MKRTFYLALCLLICTLLLAVLPVNGEENIYRDVIRLHILAASDSEEDQRAKLAVRDAVLEKYGSALSDFPNRESAAEAARGMLGEIEETAREALAASGCDSSVTVTLSEEAYPTRDYGSFSLPAGTYLSLRVLIGEAAGHNWWCVLYPPMCLGVCTDADTPLGLTEPEYGLMTENGEGKYTVKFRVLELLEQCFS